MIDETLLKDEERAVLQLRSLYRSFGYTSFKMSKFEEYELYAKNKDFLISDRIITFNDTNGRLLALKPDVTLSIIRAAELAPGVKQKFCYNENVYRVDHTTHRFREIMQAGLECIGDIDFYDVFEVVSLAAQSLGLLGRDYVLEIGDLSVLSAALNAACTEKEFREKAMGFVSRKNSHELKALCTQYGAAPEDTDRLLTLVSCYGSRKSVLDTLASLFAPETLSNMRRLSALLDTLPEADKIRFDFSVGNDMRYYNGFVFRGFLEGLSDGILSGGQYGGLMRKMGKNARAIGFAVYLDLLEQLPSHETAFDTDVLLLYDESTDPTQVAAKVNELRSQGKSVSAQQAVPDRLRWRESLNMKGESHA